MTAFLAIVLVGIGTYATRAVFIVGLAERRIPARLERALEFVGPAVLSALVVTLLIDGSGKVAAGVPEVVALLVGSLVGWWTRKLLWVVAAGMAAFWVTGLWC